MRTLILVRTKKKWACDWPQNLVRNCEDDECGIVVLGCYVADLFPSSSVDRRKHTLGTKCERYRCKATGKDNVVCLTQLMVVQDESRLREVLDGGR